MGIWNKLQQWLHRMNLQLSPLDYIRGVIHGRVTRHLSALSESSRSPISIVAGDFNASWDGRHGPHRGLANWARSAGLVNPGTSLTSDSSPPVTFYSGLRPVGAIDHVLLSGSCPGTITQAAIADSSFWSSISDHRPPLLGLRLEPHVVPSPTGQVARPTYTRVEAPRCLPNVTHTVTVSLPYFPPTHTPRHRTLPTMYSKSACALQT